MQTKLWCAVHNYIYVRCFHVQRKLRCAVHNYIYFICFHVQTKLWCAVENWYIKLTILYVVMCRKNCDMQFTIIFILVFSCSDKMVMFSWELIYQFVSMCRQNCDVLFTIIFILDVLIYQFDNFRCCHVQTKLWCTVQN
jgi:hypothetical protein